MRFCVAILISLCLLAGCTSSNENIMKFAETIELAGKRWNANDNLGRVYDLGVSGNYMYVRNDWGETKLSLINISDKEDTYNFGICGDAPNELINPGPVIFHPHSIDVFDGSKMALLRYDVDNIIGGDSLATEVLFRTDLPGIISLVNLPKSNYYVASGVFQEGRLCLMDEKGAECAYFGGYPSDEDLTEIPFHVLGVAYQSLMCTQNAGKRTALVARYGGILQIHEWDVLKKIAKEICCINNFSPRLVTQDMNGTPNFRPDENTRWGYLSVAATSGYIFALYSGRFQKKENAFYLGNEVHVFDWDGNPCYLLNLDCDGSSLAVNENKMFVLAEYENEGYDIVEYNLSLK